jgi:hypothetical protein
MYEVRLCTCHLNKALQFNSDDKAQYLKGLLTQILAWDTDTLAKIT